MIYQIGSENNYQWHSNMVISTIHTLTRFVFTAKSFSSYREVKYCHTVGTFNVSTLNTTGKNVTDCANKFLFMQLEKGMLV